MRINSLFRKVTQNYRKITCKKPFYPVEKASLYWVDDVPTLLWTIKRLKKEGAIGVDTETNSLYAYNERVCLVQLSSWDEDFIIDPLAFSDPGELSRLNELTSDPNIVKILHGADYDVSGLKRDFQIDVVNIFDTYLASRYLCMPRIGLGDLVDLYFNIHLNKELTKHNWGKRPISDAHIMYAREDVRYIVPLMKILEEKLREVDILSEIKTDFGRLSTREWNVKDFDNNGFIKIRGAKELNPTELKYLKELFIFREKKAEEINIPAFKILSSKIMIDLCRLSSRENIDRNKIYSLKGLPGFQRYKLVKEIERVLVKAEKMDPVYIDPFEKKVTKKDGLRRGRPSQAYFSRRKAKEALKKWRVDRAKELVHPNAVLPNFALDEILKEAPGNLDDLENVQYLGKSRVKKYGNEILGVLRDCRL